MAVIDWPATFGYAEFSEQPRRSRGPYVQRSAFTGKPHVSYGGGRRRHGRVVTPVSRTGQVQTEITSLVQQLSDPANQLRFEMPRVSGAAQHLTVHVTNIRPPELDERGTWRGWVLEFVETGSVVDPLPGLLEELNAGLPIDVRGDIVGNSDTDRYDWSITMSTLVLAMLTELASGRAGDIGFAVYEPDGNITSLFAHTRNGSALFASSQLEAGNYYIVVGTDTDADTNTPYRLRVVALGPGDSLPLNRDSEDNIQGASDIDVYPFTVSADTDVLVLLTALTSRSAGEIGFAVYEPDGNTTSLVAHTRNGSAIFASSQLEAGNYYIVVGATTDADTDTPYRLQITELDYTGRSVPFTVTSEDNIQGASDIDVYPFTVAQGDRVRVRLDRLTSRSAGEIGFAVYEPDGNITSLFTNTTNGSAIVATSRLAAGNYYIVVGTDTDADTNTPYRLRVNTV